MADYMNNMNTNSQSAALLHTLQRHRDILQDYSSEFYKTRNNIMAYKEREDLLGSVRRDIEYVPNDVFARIFWTNQFLIITFFYSAYKSSSGMNRRSDLYLKENEHLRK